MMVAFLNTLFLFALPAVLLPLLIHLFTRRKLKKIPFASLVFLKVLQRQRMRHIKKFRWLLLLLRTLIILVLVFTFARPALKGVFSAGLGSSARSTAVILLDNSGSMLADSKRGIHFEQAKERVRKIIRLLENEDRVHLVIFNDRIEFINEEATMNRAWLLDIVDQTECSFRKTDTKIALRVAERLLARSTDINREVYLISDDDGCEVRDSVLTLGKNITVYVSGQKKNSIENIAVTSAGPDNQIFVVSRPLRIHSEISNYSSGSPVTIPVSLHMDGERVNEATVTVAPGETQQLYLGFLPEHSGWYSGSIATNDDNLAADNRCYFSFRIQKHINVLIVHNNSESGQKTSRFLQYALDPSRELTSVIRPKLIQQSDLAKEVINEYDVVILADNAALTTLQERQLIQFNKRGGSLIVFPGSATNPRSINRIINNVARIKLLQSEGIAGQSDSYFRFKNIDLGHPVFKDIFSTDFESPDIYVRYRLQVPAESRSLIQFRDGKAALIEKRGAGKGPLFLFAFGFDPHWSNFSVQAGFVPLLHRLIQYAVSDANMGKELFVGDTFRGTFSDISVRGKGTIHAPDAQIYTVALQAKNGETKVVFDETNLPGIYSLRCDDVEMGRFAINVPIEESDLRVKPTRRGFFIADNAKIIPIDEHTDIVSTVHAARHGREIYSEAVWLVLALLVVEMLVVIIGRARRVENK